MNALATLLKIAGSLGLFLYGMKILSDGLQKSAGKSMKRILSLMTGNRVFSILTGVLITMIIQSSSATTVMVVSFVNAGLLNLTQAIGVILGANIGTTVTGWIVAILGFKMDITTFALISIAIALPLMFSSKVKLKDTSGIFLGFGLLFLGLTYLQTSMPDISGNTAALSFLSIFEDGSLKSRICCVIIGCIFTLIVQSSSASMAITITMTYQGWIGVNTAAALCLGQNIGTTVTAYLASIGASTAARRASWAHILFNVIGTVIAVAFFRPFMALINYITPGDIYALAGTALNETLPTFLAAFHTVFNTVNTLLFFPFIPAYARFISRIIKDKKGTDNDEYSFPYLASKFVEAPEVYLLAVNREVSKMADLSYDMFSTYRTCFNRNSIDVGEKANVLRKKEIYADQMQEQLTAFCVKMQQDSPTPTNAKEISVILREIDEIESVTDSIYNLIKLTEQRIDEGLTYDENAVLEVTSLMDLVSKALFFVKEHAGKGITSEELEYAEVLERSIDSQHQALSERAHQRLSEGSANVHLELMTLEVERNLEHIGDYCVNISESLGSNLGKATRA